MSDLTSSTGIAMPVWLQRLAKHRALFVPVGFVMLLVVILVPLEPWLLDVMIASNIALAVVVLLTTIYMTRPLDFSVFPSLLLATTLLRLVLNVASTRLILTADASSPEEAMGVAGQVISAFGGFVAGGSLVVGIIIFMILVIVQFVVVTKGATRISEVAARFTLDAMPGKQMAIDADLNAGLIEENEARQRREEISREADFFGSMDGASKFVRGDAIAGIIIILINIIGGFAIGTIERGWPAGQTAEVFTTLTIGDGLTSQIPSFVIAISSALIVTRSGSKQDLGSELTGQLGSQPIGLGITAGFLGLLALTPLPTLPMLAAASALGAVAFGLGRTRVRERTGATEAEAEAASRVQAEPPSAESLLGVDTLELEVGYGLVRLVDANQGGDLLDRISAIRRQLAAEMGFILPPVRIRDNMQIEASAYRIKIRDSIVASGKLEPDRLLAMDSGIASGRVDGIPTKEPAFGLEAWWIEPQARARAETLNYTVVDPTSVLATHLTEVVKTHAPDLLTRDEVSALLAKVGEKAPKLVEETVPALVKPGELQKVLQNLLRERVPIRDLEGILEAVGDWAGKTKDSDVLTEYARNALRRAICQQYVVQDEQGVERLPCVTLDPALEDTINGYVDRSGDATRITMPARVAGRIGGRIVEGLEALSSKGLQPVVLASPPVRAVVRQLIEPHVPTVGVLGYNEVVPGVEVESVALVGDAPAEPERAGVA